MLAVARAHSQTHSAQSTLEKRSRVQLCNPLPQAVAAAQRKSAQLPERAALKRAILRTMRGSRTRRQRL
jgi:hypothetical protein